MSGKDIGLNLISFGAYGRVKKVTKKYEGVFSEYTECHEAHGNLAAELSMALLQLAEEKRSAYSEAKKNREVAGDLHAEEHNLAENEIATEDYALKHVDGAVNAGEVALSTVAGAALGAGVLFALWKLAGKFDSAITSDAIAALTGMDRVKATAVWLGGGLLPDHAGNPAVGILVLAGVFLVPALLVSSSIFRFFARRKIEKTSIAMEQTEEIILRIKSDLPRLETLKAQAKDMIKSVQESKKVFLDWYEVCCMNDAQRKEKLKNLAASMMQIINTPMSEPSIALAAAVEEVPASESLT